MKLHINVAAACILTVILFTGCGINDRPRMRPGCLAANVANSRFTDINSLGRHNSVNFWGEHNGIVYTCRGGHIDIAHARIAADTVRYMYGVFRNDLQQEKQTLTYKLNTDKSVFHVDVKYPTDLKGLSADARNAVLDSAALSMAEYATWTMVSWHEVMTWFGYKSVGFVPEYASALSWEDNYSNLLGVLLGSQALQGPGNDFDDNMTMLLNNELNLLGIKPKAFAIAASEKTRGRWFSGYIFPFMKLRGTDVGLDDGYVSPFLVPGMCNSAQPKLYPVPNLEKMESLGFRVKVSIEPREWESGAVLKICGNQARNRRLDWQEGMKIILEYIKTECPKRGERTDP